MTGKEYELVQYLRNQNDSFENLIMVKKEILEKSLCFFIENQVEILSLSAVKMIDEQLEKVEGLFIDYRGEDVGVERIMEDVSGATEIVTHFEMNIGLNKKD